MPHLCIPGIGFATGPEFQKASKSISPSPRLSFPSRLPCRGMRSGERSDPEIETCDCNEMGMVLPHPPDSGPVPPGTTEAKLLLLV